MNPHELMDNWFTCVWVFQYLGCSVLDYSLYLLIRKIDILTCNHLYPFRSAFHESVLRS